MNTAYEVQHLPIDQLHPSPDEPPGRLEESDELRQLAESIDSLGLLQPISVAAREGGGHWIRFGHRRWAAAKLLGLETVPCMVREDRGDALEVLIAENSHRQGVDPLAEAQLVARLLDPLKEGTGSDGEPRTHAQVAKALGRSPRWVARRANLLNLSPRLIELRRKDEVLAQWPPLWLEELALLSPAQQDELMGVEKERKKAHPELLEEAYHSDATMVDSIEELRTLIAKELMLLRRAPWDLHDPELVPAVGSCSECPKTTAAASTLFGIEAGGDLESAQCRDRKCWNGKARATLDLKVTQAQEKHPDLVLVHDHSSRGCDRHDGKGLPKGVPVLDAHEYHLSSKKAGGRPALIIDGDGEGKVKYIKRGPKTAGADAPGKGGPMVLADKELRLKKQRRNHAILELKEELEKTSWAELMTSYQRLEAAATEKTLLLDLVARFGCNIPRWTAEQKWGAAWGTMEPLPEADRNEEIWQEVRRSALDHLRGELNAEAKALPQIALVAQLIGFDWRAAVADAKKALPEPKSWARERKAGKAAKAKSKGTPKPPPSEANQPAGGAA